MELLRAGQPEQPRPAGAVGGHLDVGQQLGSILDFVNQDGRREALHEERRIALRQAQHQRIVQGDVGAAVLAELPEQGGLADLPRAGEQHDRELLAGPDDGRLEWRGTYHAAPPGSSRLMCI